MDYIIIHQKFNICVCMCTCVYKSIQFSISKFSYVESTIIPVQYGYRSFESISRVIESKAFKLIIYQCRAGTEHCFHYDHNHKIFLLNFLADHFFCYHYTEKKDFWREKLLLFKTKIFFGSEKIFLRQDIFLWF